MNDPTLLLVLDAPMQAWGYLSLFDRRACLHYPTRSALVGMFCAAAGIDRTDNPGLRRWDALKLEVQTYAKQRRRVTPQDLTQPARAGKPIRFRRWWDFHTIGGGYDEKTHRYCIPFSAEGKPRGVVITRREYLADACFVVFVTVRPEANASPQLLEELCHYLCNPRWGVWFGRKACVPAFPICHGVHPSREEALKRLEELARLRPMDLTQPLRIVSEVDQFEEGTDTLLDMPVDFARRLFAPRRVKEGVHEEPEPEAAPADLPPED